jgi:hypothetical protein
MIKGKLLIPPGDSSGEVIDVNAGFFWGKCTVEHTIDTDSP